MQISHVLKKQYPGKIRCLNTNSESPLLVRRPSDNQNVLSLCHKSQNDKATASIKNGARFHTSAPALLFGTWHRLLIFLCATQRDLIGQHLSP